MDILTRIYQLRQERGWSEYRLAVNEEIAQSTISTWYKKDQLPNILSLERICKGFGITMAEFFGEKREWIRLTKEQECLLEIWKTFSPLQRSRTLEWMIPMRP